jgi:hypothetical protein
MDFGACVKAKNAVTNRKAVGISRKIVLHGIRYLLALCGCEAWSSVHERKRYVKDDDRLMGELHNLYCLPDLVTQMNWARCVVRVGGGGGLNFYVQNFRAEA